jgi:hypothetical protein
MRTITNEELKAAVRQAKKEKRLARMYGRRYKLQDTLENGKCVVCAIGAALTEEELRQAKEACASTIFKLSLKGVVQFEDPDFAADLIEAHDEAPTIRPLNKLIAA